MESLQVATWYYCIEKLPSPEENGNAPFISHVGSGELLTMNDNPRGRIVS